MLCGYVCVSQDASSDSSDDSDSEEEAPKKAAVANGAANGAAKKKVRIDPTRQCSMHSANMLLAANCWCAGCTVQKCTHDLQSTHGPCLLPLFQPAGLRCVSVV